MSDEEYLWRARAQRWLCRKIDEQEDHAYEICVRRTGTESAQKALFRPKYPSLPNSWQHGRPGLYIGGEREESERARV